MDYILVSVLSIVVYNMIVIYLYRKSLHRELDAIEKVQRESMKNRRKVAVEQIQGQLFAYDAATNTFLTKFDDLTDLANKLQEIDARAVWMFTEKAYEDYYKFKGVSNVQ